MEDRNQNWPSTIEQHAEKIVNDFGGYLTFKDLKTLVVMAKDILEEVEHEDTDLTLKEKVVALIEHILDNTDTPWLDDSMSDPFMKTMAASVVEYVLPDINDVGELDNANGDDDCIWRRCGNRYFFRC